jgi:hypothetical protein
MGEESASFFVFAVILRACDFLSETHHGTGRAHLQVCRKQAGRRGHHSAKDGVPGKRFCSFRGVTLERSPKGEATDDRLVFVFAFLVVIPEGNLLLFPQFATIFAFSAQKSHVKPYNRQKTCPPTHNNPDISCRQSAF